MRPLCDRCFFTSTLLLCLAASMLSCRETHRFYYDFENQEILDDLHWQCRTLFRISPEHATSGSGSLEITFYPSPPGDDESYPGLSLSDFNPDWSDYRTLVLDAFLQGEKTILLGIRIDDRDNPNYADRFNKAIELRPGRNYIAIPLPDLITSGSKRPLDLENIMLFALFMGNPREQHTVFLDRLRVE